MGVAACEADLCLGQIFQYLLVRSFVSFCGTVLRQEDERSGTKCMAKSIKVLGQRVKIGNLEMFVLNMYLLLGFCTALAMFAGIVAVQLKNLPEYEEQVSLATEWATMQVAPASHVFTVLVSVSSALLLQREAILQAEPRARGKWSACGWLLMAPLQLMVFKYCMPTCWALLLHTSLLAPECLGVMVHNGAVFGRRNSKTGDGHQALLANSGNLRVDMPIGVAIG